MLRGRRLVFISLFAAVVQLSKLLLLLECCSAEKNIISTTSNNGSQLRRLRDKSNLVLYINKKLNQSNLLRDENTLKRRTSTRNNIEKQLDTSEQDISVMKGQDITSNSIRGDNNHAYQQASSGPYKSIHRETRDIEDIFNEMAHKEPQEWTVIDWIALFVFLTIFCWIYSCLCALCCCGRRVGGGGSSLLNWLCFYEICCRDGRDLDICCDYATAAIV